MMAVGLHWWLAGAAFLALGFALQVHAMDVYTSSELFVENGTKARLPCTFKSSEVVSSFATVSWRFLSDSGGPPLTIFYFSGGRPFPGSDIHFKDRVTWAGDLNKKDASVYIENVHFTDNGTYTCDVQNPPDVGGSPANLLLRVVVPGSISGLSTAAIVGIVIGAVFGFILLLAIIVFVICINTKSNKDYSGCSTSETLVPPIKQIPKKSSSDTQCLVNSVPTGSQKGPLIYAQLDHSGGQGSVQIIKSESVVYADIRKN